MDQAEQLRKLVREQNKPAGVARVLTVTSGKGGVGKSSTAVNLAVELTRLGKRVIIFDADFGLANIEIMFGIRPVYNLSDLIFHGKSLKEIVTTGPNGIGFISGGSGIQELTRLTRDQIIYLTQKMSELDEMADIIIIDTGAGISDSVLEFVSASTEVLLITTPEPTSITDAYALMKTLNKNEEFSPQNTRIRMISNRVANDKEGDDIYEKLGLVVTKFLNFKLEHLGNIPQDPMSSRAVMKQLPVTMLYPNTPAAKAYQVVARRICDDISESNENNVVKRGLAQLFSNLVRTKNSLRKK